MPRSEGVDGLAQSEQKNRVGAYIPTGLPSGNKPGITGNPSGRLKGATALEREILRTHGQLTVDVVGKLGEMALEGDTSAAKLFLERVLGQPRALDDLATLTDEDLRSKLVEALGEDELCGALGIDQAALKALREVKPQ